MKTLTTRVQQEGSKRRLFRRKFQLRVVSGPDRGRGVTCAQDQASVGSSSHNDLVLGDPAVSRHHLRIEIQPGGFLLSDLDSTNGTRLGDLGIRQVVVEDPVELRLGETIVRFTPLPEEQEVALSDTEQFGEVLGRSPLMLELFDKLRQVSQSGVTVLLEGPTGTGKELVAQEIHRHSPRRDGPFVIVDCGAIPSGLVESELFGHVRGAFTSATNDRPGAFEEASGGTIFLDEIGELDLPMQPQLLRVLEAGQIKRLGEAHYRSVDVRVVAATNRDLQRAVNTSAFRADLFYRLAVVRLRVPPLAQRPEDIDLLVPHLLDQIAARGNGTKALPQINEATLRQLASHPWPGNVRELRNFLERLVALSSSRPSDLSTELELASPVGRPSIDHLEELPFKEAKAQWTAHFDVEYLTRLLRRCNNNVAEAARRSGVDRVHLFRLIKKYHLRRD